MRHDLDVQSRPKGQEVLLVIRGAGDHQIGPPGDPAFRGPDEDVRQPAKRRPIPLLCRKALSAGLVITSWASRSSGPSPPHHEACFHPFHLDDIEIAFRGEPAGKSAEPDVVEEDQHVAEEIPVLSARYGYGKISRQKGRNDSREPDSPSSTRVAREIECLRDNSFRISKTTLPPAWYDFSLAGKADDEDLQPIPGPRGHCAISTSAAPFPRLEIDDFPAQLFSRSATLCFYRSGSRPSETPRRPPR